MNSIKIIRIPNAAFTNFTSTINVSQNDYMIYDTSISNDPIWKTSNINIKNDFQINFKWSNKTNIIKTLTPGTPNGKYLFVFFTLENILHFLIDTLSGFYCFNDLIKNEHIDSNKCVFLTSNKFKNMYNKLNLSDIFSYPQNIIFKENTNDYQGIFFDYIYIFDGYCPILASICKNAANRFTSEVRTVVEQNHSISRNCYPTNIYISRRKRNNDQTIANQQRECINENDLVVFLKTINYEEIWMEDYNLIDKLTLLKNADNIILTSSASRCFFNYYIPHKNQKIICILNNYSSKLYISLCKNHNMLDIKYFEAVKEKYTNTSQQNQPWKINIDDFRLFLQNNE